MRKLASIVTMAMVLGNSASLFANEEHHNHDDAVSHGSALSQHGKVRSRFYIEPVGKFSLFASLSTVSQELEGQNFEASGTSNTLDLVGAYGVSSSMPTTVGLKLDYLSSSLKAKGSSFKINRSGLSDPTLFVSSELMGQKDKGFNLIGTLSYQISTGKKVTEDKGSKEEINNLRGGDELALSVKAGRDDDKFSYGAQIGVSIKGKAKEERKTAQGTSEVERSFDPSIPVEAFFAFNIDSASDVALSVALDSQKSEIKASNSETTVSSTAIGLSYNRDIDHHTYFQVGYLNVSSTQEQGNSDIDTTGNGLNVGFKKVF